MKPILGEPPLDERGTYEVRLAGGEAWLRCPDCKGTFARDEEVTQRRKGESVGCPRCGHISYIGGVDAA